MGKMGMGGLEWRLEAHDTLNQQKPVHLTNSNYSLPIGAL